MIEIKELHKSFPNNEVLAGIDLEVNTGEIFGLIGHSGAGKSTLLRCINGLERYDSGHLLVDGREVSEITGRDIRLFRKTIGMVFQQFSLLNRLTVYENIALPMKWWGYPRTERRKRVAELAEMVGIAEKLNAKPAELSGGQKQRVAIARALALKPNMLLCDEATSALDPGTAQSVLRLLDGIRSELGLTIVIVTHQMSVLRSICERAAIIDDGRIAQTDTVENLFLRPSDALRNLMGDGETLPLLPGRTIRILLSNALSCEPVLTQMSRELNVNFLILKSEIQHYRSGAIETFTVHLAENDVPAVQQYLDRRGIRWADISSEAVRQNG